MRQLIFLMISFAEACQDRYLDIAIEEAVREKRTVRTETQSWAKGPTS